MNKKVIKYLTKIIIKSSELESYEQDVKSFQIEVYLGDENKPTILLNSYESGAKKIDDFKYKGTNDVVVENMEVGHYYWFRTRLIKQNGETGQWSDFTSERAGDLINELIFTSKEVISKSTAVTFRVTASPIPEDFDKFAWKFTTQTANLLDNPDNPPAEPTAPDLNAVPDFETTALDDISISFNESRKKWWHVWVRALDKSGNISPTENNGWYYVGCGKIQVIEPTSDIDDKPPYNTAHIVPTGIEDVNFI